MAAKRKSPTPSSQDQIIAKVKSLPALSCIICKAIFSTQAFLKSHMKVKHRMSNEKINQVLCKIWMENNKLEMAAESQESPPTRTEDKELSPKATPLQDQSSILLKEKAPPAFGEPAVLNIAENILGSINNFLLGSNEQANEKIVSLEEREESKEGRVDELKEVKVEESIEEEVDLVEEVVKVEVDWVEEVEKRIMSAGSLFHCSECKFNNKEENKLVEHVQTNHLPGFPGYRCPVVKCQVNIFCETFCKTILTK